MDIDLSRVVFDSAMLYYGKFDLSDADNLISSLEGKEMALSDGGVTFTSTPEIRQIAVAGSLGRKMKGFEVIVKNDGKIEGEVIPINQSLLEMSLMKKDTSYTSNKYDKYKPSVGFIKDSQYQDLLLVGTTASEESIIILMENTYNTSISLSTKDKEEGKTKVSFENAYDPKTKNEGISVYIPKSE